MQSAQKCIAVPAVSPGLQLPAAPNQQPDGRAGEIEVNKRTGKDTDLRIVALHWASPACLDAQGLLSTGVGLALDLPGFHRVPNGLFLQPALERQLYP